MSQICKILRWMCAFTIASAMAQLVSPLPWAMFVLLMAMAITYTVGQKNGSMILQVIAVGLFFGCLKCFVG